MSELPKEWRELNFMDVFDIQGGTQPPKSTFIYEPKEGYIRLLQIRDFGEKPLPTYIPLKKNLKTCNDQDILIARYGASVGRICTGMSGAYNVAMAKVIIPEYMERKYVYYILKSHVFQTEILKIERSAQDGFNKDDLAKLTIPVPPTIEEQNKIVEQLELLLGKINNSSERLERIPTILRRFRQSVLSSACSGKLTADWREVNECTENNILNAVNNFYKNASKKDKKEIDKFQKFAYINAEIENSKWIKCNIGAIGKVCNGSTPSTKEPSYWNGSIPWVSSGEVNNNIIIDTERKITEQGYDNASVKMLKKGTVLLAMIGEGKTRGQTAILNIDATINQNIAAVDLSHNLISSKYIWYWFQLCYQQNREVGNGSGPKALNCQRVRELELMLPPLHEQEEIVRRVDKLFALADKIEQKYTNAKEQLARAEKAIFAKAFRGELVR